MSEHYLGTLQIAYNPRVVEEISRTPPPDVLSYSEYLEACKRAGTLRTTKLREEREVLKNGVLLQNLLSPAERIFAQGKHVPDANGYARYRIPLDPSFAEAINREVSIFIPESARLRHTYICGSSGAGKTELFKTLIRSYVEQPIASVVAIDPAGDFVDQIAHWDTFLGEGTRRLMYFHPRLERGYTPCINPFEIEGITAEDISLHAIETKQVVAQQLFHALEEVLGEGASMSGPMRAILFPSLLALLDYPNATFRDLRRLMQDDEELIDFCKSRRHYKDVVDCFDNTFLSKKSNNQITKNAILNKLQVIFATGIFGDLTCGKSTVNLERCIQEKKIILFNLSKGAIGSIEAQAFGRLLMALLQSIAIRRATIPEHRRTTTHVFVDELQNFVTPALSDILEEARKFRMVLTMTQPYIGRGLGPELRQVVLGVNLQIAGYCDPMEANEAARLVRREADEISTLDTGEFIVRMGRHAPFRFRARDDLVDDSGRMPERAWMRLKARQLRAYYRQKDVKEPAPDVSIEPEDVKPVEPEEDSIFGTL